MFRLWLWLTGRTGDATPTREAYGVDIFLTADTEPRWLMADTEPVYLDAEPADQRWLIADTEPVFLDADTEPTFLMAELPT